MALIYTLRSFAPSGRIVAVQRLSAAADAEALSMARNMVDGAAEVARFDVWQGERRIEGVAPTIRQRKPPLVSGTPSGSAGDAWGGGFSFKKPKRCRAQNLKHQ